MACHLPLLHLLPVLLLLISHVRTSLSHSLLSSPISIAPMSCRMGGEPGLGIEHCKGPCDLRAIRSHYARHGSPSDPAAVYARGQTVTLKYQRNNHAPGGFNRVTLVPPNKMMDKKVHARNAFHFSCWGARPRTANAAENTKDKFGYSVTGNDGELHSHPKGYYETKIKIPSVVPDGKYVLGWMWFGGTGGTVKANEPQEPIQYGYFGDYWSCSYVEIRGGVQLQREYTPVFNNDMKQFSSDGCMSANDAPGVCTWEPCRAIGKYQKPRPFKNGNPKPLTPEMFGGKSPSGGNSRGSGMSKTRRPRRKRSSRGKKGGSRIGMKACRCLLAGNRCWNSMARKATVCSPKMSVYGQPKRCKDACCNVCKQRLPGSRRLCGKSDIKHLCGLW